MEVSPRRREALGLRAVDLQRTGPDRQSVHRRLVTSIAARGRTELQLGRDQRGSLYPAERGERLGGTTHLSGATFCFTWARSSPAPTTPTAAWPAPSSTAAAGTTKASRSSASPFEIRLQTDLRHGEEPRVQAGGGAQLPEIRGAQSRWGILTAGNRMPAAATPTRRERRGDIIAR